MNDENVRATVYLQVQPEIGGYSYQRDTPQSVRGAKVVGSTLQLDRGLSDADLKDALREYRSETGYSPWDQLDVGVLDVDFTNWFRWERL